MQFQAASCYPRGKYTIPGGVLLFNQLRFINISYLNKKSKFYIRDTGTLLNFQIKLADDGYVYCLWSLGTLGYVELYLGAFFQGLKAVHV